MTEDKRNPRQKAYDEKEWDKLGSDGISAEREERQKAYDEITKEIEKLGENLNPTENTLYNSFSKRGIYMNDKRFSKWAEAFESYAGFLAGKEIKKQINNA